MRKAFAAAVVAFCPYFAKADQCIPVPSGKVYDCIEKTMRASAPEKHVAIIGEETEDQAIQTLTWQVGNPLDFARESEGIRVYTTSENGPDLTVDAYKTTQGPVSISYHKIVFSSSNGQIVQIAGSGNADNSLETNATKVAGNIRRCIRQP
jgi:hypothetical protein